MAAAFLERLGRGDIEGGSAGSDPANSVDASVVRAMQEVGIDISDRRPKGISDRAVRAADVVVTMGCGDACPVFPGKRYLDWDLPDPHGRTLDEVRSIRDDIERRVAGLVAQMSA